MIDLSGFNPYLQSLMDRWNEVMSIQTERLERAPTRDEIAFREWKQSKDLSQAGQKLDIETSYQRQVEQQRELERARKAQADAEAKARMDERIRLQSSVDRNRALQSQYGGPTPFNPAGSVADYYEYGAGNPQGRGGGGDARGPETSGKERTEYASGIGSKGWKEMDLQNCLSNTFGPGCPGILEANGYMVDPQSGQAVKVSG